MADRESTAVGYRLRIEPPGGLSTYPDAVKLMWYQWVVDLALARKDRELAKGMDKNGKIGVLDPGTIKHRKSEVGPTTKTAPYGTPSYARSRVRSLLTGRAHTGSAEFWWGFDSHTGRSFAVILHYWADEYSHDVFGLSVSGTAWVTREAVKKWSAWKAAGGYERGLANVPGASPVRKAEILKPIAKREVKGRFDFKNMDLWEGEEGLLRRATKAGTFSGFRRLNARGEKWRPGHGLSNPPATPPKPPPAKPQIAAMKPAKYAVTYTEATPDEVLQTARTLLGESVTEQKLIALSGAPPGAKIELRNYSGRVTMLVKTGRSYWDVQARRDLDGKLNLEIPQFEIQKAKQDQGVARRTFKQILKQADELGIERISLIAARNDRRPKIEIGYKVWPKFGFGAEIPDRFLAILPKELEGARTIFQLYAMLGGREWWEEHGGSVRMDFDVAADSLSWETWRDYLASKGEKP